MLLLLLLLFLLLLIIIMSLLPTNPQLLSKRVLHRVGCSASSFNFHHFLLSLRYPVFFFIFPSLPSFLLHILWQCVSKGSSYARCDSSSEPYFVSFYEECSSPRWLSAILLYFPDDRYKRSSVAFSSNTLQNFKGVSDLIHARKIIWMDYSTTLLRFLDT